MRILTGLIIQSPSRISKAIQLGNMRPVNHAAVEFTDDNIIFEAVSKGIQVINTYEWFHTRSPKTVVHHVSFNIPKEQYKEALDFAWSCEKDKYSFITLTTFLPFLRSITNRLVKEDDRAWICSEFFEAVFRKAKTNFVHLKTKPDDVSPGDLFDSIRMEMGAYYKTEY